MFEHFLSIDSTACMVDAVIARVLDINGSYDYYFRIAGCFRGERYADALMERLATIQNNLATKVRALFGNECTDDDIIKILQMRSDEVQASIDRIKHSLEGAIGEALPQNPPLDISLKVLDYLRGVGVSELAKWYAIPIEAADTLFSIENPQSETSKFYETRFDQDWSIQESERIESRSTALLRP